MGSLTMLDSISETELAWALASGQKPAALSGYTAGSWPDFPQVAALAARYGLLTLSIAPFASVDADCLDVESGDATIAQVDGWFTRQQARGLTRPAVYTSAGNAAALIATMTANGIARADWRLWSAHYTGTAHICGPGTCGYPQADGTQWADKDAGHNIDQSLLTPDFFGGNVSATGPASWDAADRKAVIDLIWHSPAITAAGGTHWPSWVLSGIYAQSQGLTVAAIAAAIAAEEPTVDAIAKAVVAALPPAATGGLTQADVETAVKAVFAQAAQ